METRIPEWSHEGKPCERCGEIIQAYGTSGYCLRCWHERRGGWDRRGGAGKVPTGERIRRLLEHHAKDLTHYHYLSLDGVMVAEHRYVLERATGKSIPSDHIVHHLNGLKGDNRPENLVSMPRGDHDTKSLITILNERIRELEAICG